MIIYSAHNDLDDTCEVHIEGIEQGTPQSAVEMFARGAAGRHNYGWRIAKATVVGWLDEDGRSLPPDLDTSEATGARVCCTVEKV